MANPSKTCPECGALLNARRTGGLCPRCVMRSTLGDDSRVVAEPEGAAGDAVRLFGDYQLGRELGRGGMGVVYEALHRELHRTVALKMLQPSRLASAVQLQRFRQEAEAVAALDHPNILPVYEVGSIQGQPYFTMKMAERGSLASASALLTTDPEDLRRRVSWVAQIARAVHFAHQRGIQHRDLKPHNILLDSEERPYVADFGLAKFSGRESSLTLSQEMMGTPAYMAPEQVAGDKGNLTTASDVYGLGAILFQLITGVVPFEAETLPALLRKICEEEPDVSLIENEDLRTIVLKCLSKEPWRRYASAEALADDLERWLAGEPVMARPLSMMERGWRWCRRRPAFAGMVAALVFAILAGVVGVGVQWRRAEALAYQRELERYAADMRVASQALEGHDLGLARRMLDAQVPAAGLPDLRGFEWHLLQQLCLGDQLAVMRGHTATVTCVAISNDGKLAASGGMDSTLWIWDLQTRKSITHIQAHKGVVWSVAFTPDGERIITAGSDGKVRFWTREGRVAEEPLEGVNAALSENGEVLAVSMSTPFRYFEGAPGLRLWDWKARRVLWETNGVWRRVAMSKDGNWLAAGGEQKGIHLWKWGAGEHRVLVTEDSPWSMAFSMANSKFVAAGFGMGARVWDLSSPESAAVPLTGHRFKVWGAAFSPDGTRVVTTGSDRTLRLRGLAEPEQGTVLDGHDDEVWSVAWTPDGSTLVTASKDMTLRIWSARPSVDQVGFKNRIHWRPQFSKSGRRILTLNESDVFRSKLVLRELDSGVELAEFESRWAGGFSDNGEDVVTWDDNTLKVDRWIAATGERVGGPKLQGARGPALGLGFAMSQNGRVFAVAFEGEMMVWRLEDGIRIGTFPIPRAGAPLAMSLSPEGDRLAFTVGNPYTIWLYHLSTGGALELTGHTEEVKGLAFSPDGRLLASAGVDRVVRLWDTSRGTLLGELVGYYEEASGVSFSPDGRLLASIGSRQSLILWHLATQRQMMSLATPEASDRITFSPGGDFIAYTADPQSIRFLGIPRKQSVQSLAPKSQDR